MTSSAELYQRLLLRKYEIDTAHLISTQILTALAEKSAITTKAFGKANLYWTKQVVFRALLRFSTLQDEMPEVDKEGFAKLEASVAEIKAEQHDLNVRKLLDARESLPFSSLRLRSYTPI